MRKAVFFIISLLAIACIQVNAQEKPILFKHLTEENGLPTNDVSIILQDSYGIIWIGTREGLVRYDGARYRLYQSSRASHNTIPSNDVLSLLETKDKRLLIATSNGLAMYDLQSEAFTSLPVNKAEPEKGPATNYISALYPENGNRYWIRYQNFFSLLDLDSMSFRHFSTMKDHKDRFNSLRAFTLHKGNDGASYLKVDYDHIYKWKNDIWTALPVNTLNETALFVDARGLMVYSNERFMIYDQGLGAAATEVQWNFTSSNVRSVSQDKLGNIWATSDNDGIFIIDPRTQTVLNHYRTETESGLKTNSFEHIIQTGQEMLFLSKAGEGLYRYNTPLKKFQVFKNNPADPLSISQISGNTFYLTSDNSGTLWFCPEGAGINYFNFNQTKFLLIRNSANDAYPMKGASNRGVFANDDKTIWMGNDKAIYNYDRPSKTYKAFSSNIANAIYVENQTDVWIGELSLINYRYNPTDKSLQKVYDYQPDPAKPGNLSGWNVTYINTTRDGVIWVGCSEGLSMLKQRAENGIPEVFVNYKYDMNDTTGIPGRVTWHFYEDDKGLLWVSTVTGLGVLNRATGKFKQYKFDPDDPESLSTDNVKFVNQDYRGRYWIATEGGGLCLLNEKTGKFKNFTTQDGLPSNTIYSIFQDSKNRFWMSTKKGISSFHPDSMLFTNYSVTDGLQDNAFNIQSFCQNNSTGELLFGGLGGFNIFHPDSIYKDTFEPAVLITGLRISNQPVTPGKWRGNRTILETTILETTQLRLRHNENSLYLEFASLHFSAPENIRYKYYLEGFEKDWNTADNKMAFANYTNLSPGRYVFHLKATNCDGVWVNQERILTIKIRPPFWKTWWFYLAVLSLIGLLARGYIIFSERQLRLDKLALQRELNQGKLQIEEKIREVEQHEDEIRRRNLTDREQKWHDQGMVKFADILSRNKENIHLLLNKVLSQLIDYLQAETGAIFLYEENENDPNDAHLVMVESYGLNKEALSQKSFLRGEGIIGATFNDRTTNILTDIPDNYIKIDSSIGTLKPKNLMLVPIQQEDLLLGVIEVATLYEIEPYRIRFTEKLAESLTGYIYITQSSQKLKDLINRANIQSEEMKAQEEELRQNLEEMQATQEESHRREQLWDEQTKKQKEKESELNQQIKELKAKIAKFEKPGK